MIALVLVNWYTCVLQTNKNGFLSLVLFFDGKAVCFDNVEGGIVAILATYNEKGLQTLSNPFTLNHDTGEIHYLNPLQESHIISVYKKFYFAVKNYFNTRMIGGVIEGSNQKDFQNVDTLLLIKEAPLSAVYCRLSGSG